MGQPRGASNLGSCPQSLSASASAAGVFLGSQHCHGRFVGGVALVLCVAPCEPPERGGPDRYHVYCEAMHERVGALQC